MAFGQERRSQRMGGLRNTKPHLTHLLELTKGTGHESVAESGQTASTVHLWFIFSCVVFSLVSGALCLALLLLRRRLHRRPQLCSPVSIPGTSSVYLLWFTHPPSLDMDCRHCPCAPTAFLSTAACLQI